MARSAARWGPAVVLCVAAFFLWRSLTGGGPDSGNVPPERPAAPVPGEDQDPVTLADPGQREELEAPEAALDAAQADTPRATPPSPAPERIDVRLHGSAVRVDADGVEHGADDGGFTLIWRRSAVYERQRVEVSAGSWSAEVPEDAQLSVLGLTLAGVPVSLEPNQFAVPADRFLALSGSGQAGVWLHVRSALDGRELEDVEVWPGPRSFPTDVQHPGAEPTGEPVVAQSPSPVWIAPREQTWRSAAQYMVRAPGHAWGTIHIDHASSGTRSLDLEAACALTVELVGNTDWLEPLVRLWPPDASADAAYAFAERSPDAEDRARFEALPPGTYRVAAERGWADLRVAFGQAEVTLLAGDDLTLPLEITPPERPVPVTVSGTLTVPEVWGTDGLELRLEAQGEARRWGEEAFRLPVSELASRDAEPGMRAYVWSIELPIEGDYKLDVHPLVVRRLLVVPPGGLEGVDVVVPLPADAIVTVVDAGSGEEIAVDSLMWSPVRVEGIRGTPLYPAHADPDQDGRVTFRAPAGEIRLSPKSLEMELEPYEQPFHLTPGENRLRLTVRRQIGVRFTFTDGQATIPWDWSWQLGARRTDGNARDVGRGIGILYFREEGTYRLTSQGIPGYASIDGTTFDVVAGRGMIEVEVPLERL